MTLVTVDSLRNLAEATSRRAGLHARRPFRPAGRAAEACGSARKETLSRGPDDARMGKRPGLRLSGKRQFAPAARVGRQQRAAR